MEEIKNFKNQNAKIEKTFKEKTNKNVGKTTWQLVATCVAALAIASIPLVITGLSAIPTAIICGAVVAAVGGGVTYAEHFITESSINEGERKALKRNNNLLLESLEKIDNKSKKVEGKSEKEEVANKPEKEKVDNKPEKEKVDNKPEKEKVDNKPEKEKVDNKSEKEKMDNNKGPVKISAPQDIEKPKEENKELTI